MTDDLGRGSYKVDVDATDAERELAKVEADTKAKLDATEKAATDSGTRTMSKLATLGRTAATTIAAGAGAVFAGMSALAVQGENAMAKFRAETGATQDEAKAALADMDRLAGQNLQSFDTVAAALTEVRTQMGLTGAEAADMTNAILKFSTATGTDAVANVKAFDDVSDAWNMTAEDSIKLMDVLVASHQQYGGSIQESQALLNQLAPSLQAANMSWQDATAILNLFNHAGVSADAAATGLNKALQKVKSPEELQQLLSDVAATVDPFERAQKAADLFGARAGPKLALALADSGGDLTKFAINADDAAGAVDKAASAIEDTLPNKIKMAVAGALGSMRDLGTSLGPALTGAASLVSLGTSFASALHLDTAIASALRGAIGSSVVQGALNGMAGKLSFTLGAGIAAGLVFDQIMTTVNKAIGIIPDDIDKAVNEAYQAALAGGPYVAKAFADTYQQSLDEGLSKQDAYQGALQAEKDALTAAATLWSNVTQHLIEDPFAHNTSFAKPWGDAGMAAGGSWVDGFRSGVQGQGDKGGGAWNMTLGPSFEHDMSFGKAGTKAGDDFIHGVQDAHYGGISDTLTHMWSAVPTAPAKVLGADYADALANGLKAAKGEVAGAMADLRDALLHPLRGVHTVAKVEGALSSKELANGLASNDPYIRSTAEHTRDGLLAKLRALQAAGYNIGKKGMAMLGEGITAGTSTADAAASTAVGTVKGTLSDTSGYFDGGRMVGNAWASGLAAAIRAGTARAEDALRGYHGPMIGQSPPKTGPLKHIDKGGYNIGKAWAMGMADGIASVGINRALAATLPGLSSTTTVLHTGTVQVQLSGDTIAAARAQGASWSDVGAMGAAAVVDVAGVVRDLGRLRSMPTGSMP